MPKIVTTVNQGFPDLRFLSRLIPARKGLLLFQPIATVNRGFKRRECLLMQSHFEGIAVLMNCLARLICPAGL
jgi:hypothetical protein